MEQITFKILAVNGLNATVEYTCGEFKLEVGIDLPLGGTEDEIASVISMHTPTAHFERLVNPVPPDALASLVGVEGVVTQTTPVVVPGPQSSAGSRIVTFKDE